MISGHLKAVWLEIFGPVFIGFLQEIDPGTPLDRRGPPRTSISTKNQPRRPTLKANAFQRTRGPFKRTPGSSLKDPGVLLKDLGVLLKDPGVLLKDPGVLLRDPRADFEVTGSSPDVLPLGPSVVSSRRRSTGAGVF